MQPPPQGASDRYLEIPITLRFGDTDPYGIVYFASYFRYCHHGIEEFLRHVGLEPHEYFRNQQEGFGLPVVGANCDFFRPVKYGDQLRLRVSITRAKLKSITFGFAFYFKDGDAIVARGQATIVAINREWQSMPLPARVREAISPYLPPASG